MNDIHFNSCFGVRIFNIVPAGRVRFRFTDGLLVSHFSEYKMTNNGRNETTKLIPRCGSKSLKVNNGFASFEVS